MPEQSTAVLERRVVGTLAALSLLLVVAGCGSDGSWFQVGSLSAKGPPATTGIVANLRGIGSAVSGKVRVIDKGEGVTVLVSGTNLPPNQYRVSFNTTPNCSSPNGFSAGPPWAPPGLDPYSLIPLFWNADGNAEGEAFVRGVKTSALLGRSVVIYWGPKITDAQPDVPNNRAACGIFEPAGPGLLF